MREIPMRLSWHQGVMKGEAVKIQGLRTRKKEVVGVGQNSADFLKLEQSHTSN
jgi:hypothetical protein